MEMLEQRINTEIVEYIKSLPSGKIFTIADIGRNIKHAPQTVSKYMPMLLANELVQYVDIQPTDTSKRYMVRI